MNLFGNVKLIADELLGRSARSGGRYLLIHPGWPARHDGERHNPHRGVNKRRDGKHRGKRYWSHTRLQKEAADGQLPN